jgi:hypothetical protein
LQSSEELASYGRTSASVILLQERQRTVKALLITSRLFSIGLGGPKPFVDTLDEPPEEWEPGGARYAGAAEEDEPAFLLRFDQSIGDVWAFRDELHLEHPGDRVASAMV